MASPNHQNQLIANRNQCYVYSIPPQISSENETLSLFEAQLRTRLSEFGDIIDISFVNSKGGLCALFTYTNNKSAQAAIKWVNRVIFNFDGLYWKFKARFGTQTYCHRFKIGTKCFDEQCGFVHKLSNDILTPLQHTKWEYKLSGATNDEFYIGMFETVSINIRKPKTSQKMPNLKCVMQTNAKPNSQLQTLTNINPFVSESWNQSLSLTNIMSLTPVTPTTMSPVTPPIIFECHSNHSPFVQCFENNNNSESDISLLFEEKKEIVHKTRTHSRNLSREIEEFNKKMNERNITKCAPKQKRQNKKLKIRNKKAVRVMGLDCALFGSKLREKPLFGQFGAIHSIVTCEKWTQIQFLSEESAAQALEWANNTIFQSGDKCMKVKAMFAFKQGRPSMNGTIASKTDIISDETLQEFNDRIYGQIGTKVYNLGLDGYVSTKAVMELLDCEEENKELKCEIERAKTNVNGLLSEVSKQESIIEQLTEAIKRLKTEMNYEIAKSIESNYEKSVWIDAYRRKEFETAQCIKELNALKMIVNA